MQLVRTALGHDVYDGTAVASVFRFVVGEHVQLLNCVDRKNCRGVAEYTRFVDGRIVAEAIIHVGAVEQEVVGSTARTVHGKRPERAGRI